MAFKYHQGPFNPKNPEKYKGNVRNIFYRSGLEFRFMSYLDQHPSVIFWASEERFMVVPYRSPIDGRSHRYFPDFWAQIKEKDGSINTMIIEVKPITQTTPPPLGKNGKLNKNRIRAAMTYAVNEAKWNSAKLFCDQKGWAFKIITEQDIK